MTDRLTPGMLRDLAAAISYGCTWRPEWMQGLVTRLSEEAARREAEPVNVAQGIGKAIGCEREGPGSAATHDEFAHSLRSVTTVDHRWDAHALSIIRRYENDRHRAADAIDAATAEASSCAAAYKASEARVRELERHQDQFQNAAGKAAVRAEGLEDMYEKEKARADKLVRLARQMLGETYVVTGERPSSPVGRPTVVVDYDAALAMWDAISTEGGDRG